jgi:hypothetical protein
MAGNKPITEQISDAVGAAGQKVGETFEAAKAQAASVSRHGLLSQRPRRRCGVAPRRLSACASSCSLLPAH